MSVVDISGLDPVFFITVALFLLFILAMLGLGVLRCFQEKVRQGLLFFAVGAVAIVAFVIVLNVAF